MLCWPTCNCLRLGQQKCAGRISSHTLSPSHLSTETLEKVIWPCQAEKVTVPFRKFPEDVACAQRIYAVCDPRTQFIAESQSHVYHSQETTRPSHFPGADNKLGLLVKMMDTGLCEVQQRIALIFG